MKQNVNDRVLAINPSCQFPVQVLCGNNSTMQQIFSRVADMKKEEEYNYNLFLPVQTVM